MNSLGLDQREWDQLFRAIVFASVVLFGLSFGVSVATAVHPEPSAHEEASASHRTLLFQALVRDLR